MGFLRKASGKGRLGAAVAASAAVVAGMVALAAPASAHHSNISASAQCVSGEGVWRVSWTASTWSTDTLSGSHPAVLVQYSTSSSSGPWTTVPNDSSAMPYADAAETTIPGVGAFRNPGSPSFTGFIDFAPSASDQSVWVRSVPIDDVPASGPWFWDDDFFSPADGGDALDTRAAGANLTWLNGQDSEDGSVTNKITLEGGECQPPAEPAAELKAECATQHGVTGIEILLTNTGGTAATFTVEGVGGTIDVAAGGTATVFVPVAEDAAYSIDVEVGGQPVAGSPVAGTRDCATPEPSAALADECAVSDGVEGITVTLTNAGDQEVTFDVEGIGDVVVGAEDAETVFVPVDENSSYSIDVIALGAHVPGSPIEGTRDCRQGVGGASVESECATEDDVEGVAVELTNTGDDDVTFQVGGGGDVVVGPGESTTVFVPVDENSDYAIEVTSDGQALTTLEGTRDCRQGVAGVSIAEVCATEDGIEGILLTLANTGDDDITFQVDGGSDIVVAGGASLDVFVPVAENSAYAIPVTSLGATVGLLEGTRDCRHPDPSVELGDECAEGGVEIVVSNTGDDDTVVQVGGEDVEVPAGGDVSVVVPVDEGADYSITVTVDGETIGTFEGTRNCAVDFLELDATGDCVDNVARISWNIGVDLADDGQTLTIRWYDLDGNLQLTQSGLPLVGSTEWPGIVVGPDGSAVDWPGWLQEDDGTWVQGDDGFEWARPAVRVTFEVNPTSDPIEVAYPPATPGCTDPEPTTTTTTLPTEVEGVQNPRPLPRTGGETSRSLVVGLALLISGAGVVLLAADRRRAANR